VDKGTIYNVKFSPFRGKEVQIQAEVLNPEIELTIPKIVEAWVLFYINSKTIILNYNMLKKNIRLKHVIESIKEEKMPDRNLLLF
jgi:hypothetical protein